MTAFTPITPPMAVPPAPHRTRPERAFISKLGFVPAPGLARLLLSNAALTLLTLGVYRFWAKTRLRRYYWNSIVVGGEPLEYAGRGLELFIGFLIALVVLLPLGFMGSALQQLALQSPATAAVLQLGYLVLVYLLGQVARFRARRYRLTRTLWRGIRAGQDGSTWAYLGLAALWAAAVVASLGLAAPWAMRALQRYRTGVTRFGDRPFSLEAGVGPLVRAWMPVWLLLVVPPVLFVLLNAEAFAALDASTADESAEGPEFGFFGLLASGWTSAALAYVGFRIKAFRHFAAGTRLGEVEFRSHAEAKPILKRAAGFVAVMALASLAIFVVAGVALGVTADPAMLERLAENDPPFAFMVVAYAAGLAVYIVGTLLLHLMVLRPALRHFSETFTVMHLGTIDSVQPSAAPAPRFGEGLADSFDFAVT